jgi:hypothetical protein
LVRGAVMRVLRVPQRNQNIYEERAQELNLLPEKFIDELGCGELAGSRQQTESIAVSGILRGVVPISARRARSEITFPTDLFSVAAIALAAERTSSSTSSVVRMQVMWRIRRSAASAAA